MATLPIKFPDDWPDMVVTSHIRKDGTSHSTGNAVDLAFVWPSRDYSPSSKYWFYHFHTFFTLWATQNQGLTRMSAPTACPHFHLYNDPSINSAGVEFLKSVLDANGKRTCKLYSAQDVPKKDIWKSIKLHKFIENVLGKGDGTEFLQSYQNILQDYKTKFNFSKRIVHVSSSIPTLSDSDLQTILDSMYGGNTSDKVLNNLAQIVDLNNWPELKKSAADSLLSVAIIGGAAWYLWQYAKEEFRPHSETQPRQISQ
jgi:hypothetical protein